MSDVEHQNINTVHSQLQPKPRTIASAATVAPETFITMVTGVVAIDTITPPVTGAHMLCFIFTAAVPVAFGLVGNVAVALAPTQNLPVLLFYDPVGARYYPK
jgi:hypothetical protein